MRRLASLVAVLTASLPADAAEAGRIALFMPSCALPGVDAAELRRAIALDLQPEGLVVAPPGELTSGRDVEVFVEADCSTPEQLTLRAERGSERRARSLRLSELATEQRPRALSLALSELVSLVLHPEASSPATPSSEPEPEPKLEPEPPAATSPPPAPTPSTVADEPTPVGSEGQPRRESGPAIERVTWRLGIAPQVRFFAGTSLWGAQVQLSRGRWRYGTGLLVARRDVATGQVSTQLVSASAGYAFSLLGDAKSAALESGPRLGIGYAFLRANAAEGATGHDARDAYLDAAWTARFEAAISDAARLGVGAELGYGHGPIGYADNTVVARTAGTFATLSLNASLRL